MLLTLPDAARSRNANTDELNYHPVKLVISLRHRFRECGPRVVVAPEPVWSGTRYDFTRDEAYQLGTAALEAVMVIDGQPIPCADSDQTHLPYWWHPDRDHPHWCRKPHEDGDYSSDRDCLSLHGFEKTIYPSLAEAARSEQSDGAVRINTVTELEISLRQRYREYAPRVVIAPEYLTEGGPYELTRDEAEQLGRALREAVLVVDNQPARQDR
ncbi:hypothetical protein [Haloechinothrix salitolerans]|uniref:Uncharacterized protein n=1 Tax=Haloechinothrix salitolerans TaxID=926830 RepID=A0ABW2BUQ8_9PSEU